MKLKIPNENSLLISPTTFEIFKFENRPLPVDAKNKMDFHVNPWLVVLQLGPDVCFSAVLPGWGLCHALVSAVVPPVHEKGGVQFLAVLVDPVDLEPDFVGPLGPALGLSRSGH